MRRLFCVVLSLLMMMVFSTGMALAKSGKGNGHGNSGASSKAKAARVVNVKPQNSNSNASAIGKLQQELKTQKNNSRETGKFKDVKNHWAVQYIDNMVALGLLTGYPDETFAPDQPLTQGEAIILIWRLAGEDEEEADAEAIESTLDSTGSGEESTPDEEQDDEDVDEENNENEDEIDEDLDAATEEEEDSLDEVPGWARNSVEKAAGKGWINMNRFHSAVQASRAETAVTLAIALGLEPVDTSDMPFSDISSLDHQDVGYILALYQGGYITGSPGGKFNPNSAITRAEMAALMQRIIEENASEDVVEQNAMPEDDGSDDASDDQSDDSSEDASDDDSGEAPDEGTESEV